MLDYLAIGGLVRVIRRMVPRWILLRMAHYSETSRELLATVALGLVAGVIVHILGSLDFFRTQEDKALDWVMNLVAMGDRIQTRAGSGWVLLLYLPEECKVFEIMFNNNSVW